MKPDRSSIRGTFGFLAGYLKPQRRQVALLAVLLFGGIALQLINPQVIRYFLDTATSGGPQRALYLAAGLFIAFALLQHLLSAAAGTLGEDVGWRATNRLRADLTLHLLRLDMPFHKQHSPGELIGRIDWDAAALANFFSSFAIQVAGNALLVAGILVLLFREDAGVGFGLTLFTLLMLAALGWVQRLATPRWAASQQAWADQLSFLEERIAGAEEIRAAGAESYTMNRLYRLLQNTLVKGRAAYLANSLTTNLTGLLFAGGYAAGLALGVYLYTQGRATLGTAYLIVYYVGMLAAPLQSIRAEMEDMQRAAASLQRVGELFRLQPAVREPAAVREPSEANPPSGAQGVEFRGVCFGYEDGGHVLEDVSFAARPGSVLGVLGRTGSGKTTLARLLFRLYDPACGAIRLDGTDLRELPAAELRRRVGMVTQDVELFPASIRDNITFFNPRIEDGRVRQALEELRLWDWVSSRPGGLDARLAAGGQGLSAGEAQLLAFARVFLKDPGVVVLDEASSRLDPATERLLERAVDCLLEKRTGILIAHRLGTVQRADELLILENGRVAEYGPRPALAADPGSRFSRLLQTGMEEVLA